MGEEQNDERGGAYTLREGYRVHAGKEAWADELFAACRRLRLGPDYKGRPSLRRLSEHAGLRGPNTLRAALSSPGYPEISTLILLEQNAGVPVARSLLALGVLTRAGLEAELGIPAADLPADVMAAWAGIMAAIPVLPREPLARLFAALLELRGPDPGGNTHGPSPTTEGR